LIVSNGCPVYTHRADPTIDDSTSFAASLMWSGYRFEEPGVAVAAGWGVSVVVMMVM